MQPAPQATDAELVAALADAQRRVAQSVDATRYSALDRAAGYHIHLGVLAALGQTAGMLKTGIHPDGVGVAAPIYASNVGRAPGFRLSAATVTGLEVEVGVVLARDIPPGPADEQRVAAAVDHYFLGVEICGTRFTDRKAAGLNGGLADNMSSLGYAIGPRRPRLTTEIDGLGVTLEFGGQQIYAAPTKHGFGTVLASLVAYAANQLPAYPLRGGTIITTGSLCGLVPTSGAGHVVARLGDEMLAFEIV